MTGGAMQPKVNAQQPSDISMMVTLRGRHWSGVTDGRENHDDARVCANVDRTVARLRSAAEPLLTAPGSGKPRAVGAAYSLDTTDVDSSHEGEQRPLAGSHRDPSSLVRSRSCSGPLRSAPAR
jgi:hypothetical protein